MLTPMSFSARHEVSGLCSLSPKFSGTRAPDGLGGRGCGVVARAMPQSWGTARSDAGEPTARSIKTWGGPLVRLLPSRGLRARLTFLREPRVRGALTTNDENGDRQPFFAREGRMRSRCTRDTGDWRTGPRCPGREKWCQSPFSSKPKRRAEARRCTLKCAPRGARFRRSVPGSFHGSWRAVVARAMPQSRGTARSDAGEPTARSIKTWGGPLVRLLPGRGLRARLTFLREPRVRRVLTTNDENGDRQPFFAREGRRRSRCARDTGDWRTGPRCPWSRKMVSVPIL